MKIKIKDQIIDPSVEPILLIFDNDFDRKKHIENLSSMKCSDGVRKYLCCPENMTEDEVREFMFLGDEND